MASFFVITSPLKPQREIAKIKWKIFLDVFGDRDKFEIVIKMIHTLQLYFLCAPMKRMWHENISWTKVWNSTFNNVNATDRFGQYFNRRKSLRWLIIFLKNVYYSFLQDLLSVFHEVPHIITQRLL